MVSKDQAIGGLIFLVCVVVIIGYIAALFLYPFIKDVLALPWGYDSVKYWLAEIPVLIAFVAVLGIGAWIGWTMATTPPPKPIEEFATEEKKEEKVEEEGKKEEEAQK